MRKHREPQVWGSSRAPSKFQEADFPPLGDQKSRAQSEAYSAQQRQAWAKYSENQPRTHERAGERQQAWGGHPQEGNEFVNQHRRQENVESGQTPAQVQNTGEQGNNSSSSSCTEWPASMVRYTNKCLHGVEDDSEKQKILEILHEKFSAAFLKDEVLTTNWDDEEIVRLPRSEPRPSHVDWPNAMKEYINRCLAQCSDPDDKRWMESELKDRVAFWSRKGLIYSKDWPNEKLVPVYNRENKKKQRDQVGWVEGGTKEPSYPDAMRNYMHRCLQQYHDASDKQRMQQELNIKIEAWKKSPIRFSRDWANEPLITLYKRAKSTEYLGLSPTSAGSNLSRWDQAPCNTGVGSWGALKFGKPTDTKKSKWGKAKVGIRNIVSEEDIQKQKRLERFRAKPGDDKPAKVYNPRAAGIQARRVADAMHRAENAGIDLDLSTFAVKGTCEDLEKRYLRLTGVPDPSTVRPESVLIKSLEMVESRWTRSSLNKHRSQAVSAETPGVTYLWVCEQLKSIRQDLTIQHIKNNFTARAYECHAQIALKEADLKEFNQCLTQLQDLYRDPSIGTLESKQEYSAYGVLYLVYTHLRYGQSVNEIGNLLLTMPKIYLESKNVQHALAVRSSIKRGMHFTFLRLRKDVPALGKYLVDMMVDYVRFNTLKMLCKAFRPSLPLEIVKKHLGISVSELDEKAWNELVLQNRAIVLSSSETSKTLDLLDTKASLQVCSSSFEWPVLEADRVPR